MQIIDDDDLDDRMQLRLVKRQLRDESNPFDISKEQFRKHYRMVQWVIMDLIERLTPFLPYHQHGVPPHLQVLATVRFMAEGSYQKGLGQDFNHPMSQSSISNFEQHLGFPGVISLIDCTLIGVHKPSEHEEAFLDHHQNHSMNVQVLCDLDYNIQNLRICNGSTHDAFSTRVWRNSEARAEMITIRQEADTAGGRRYFIIGDSGYTQSPYILTPINEAQPASSEFEYSQVIRRTRCRVEQLFGIWKEVIRCLNGDRILHYGPEFAAQIIRAGAVLYNFLRHHGMPMPVAPRINEHRRVNPVFVDDDYVQGVAIRQAIIEEYFRGQHEH